MELKSYKNGFTLIELLVVISIIGTLSTVALTSLNGARAKARDAKRLSDVEQIVIALDMYYSDHGNYPHPVSADGSWETSFEDGADFLDALKDQGYFPNGVPVDPVNGSGKYYSYYVYGPGDGSCPLASGEFYVLGIKDLEASVRPYPRSPGWKCDPLVRDWQTEFDWVTGKFEN